MLIDRRHKLRLTQQQVAKLAGWRQNAISKIETGSHRVTVLELVRLSEVLEFDPHTVIRRIKATPFE
jgi:transcriptional regulator with XRE-family HTH domain